MPPFASGITINVFAIDDLLVEGDHLAYVDNVIIESTDGSYISTSRTVVTRVPIIDNDGPKAGLVAPSPYEVWEGDNFDIEAFLAAPADQVH